MNRLLRHDGLIVCNVMRVTFAHWHDRLLAASMLVVGLVFVRSWLADHSGTIATGAALVAGTAVGASAARALNSRLAFHAFDGLLAVDALHPQKRLHYMAAWHGIGLMLLIVVTAILRPSLLIAVVPGYFVGMMVAQVRIDLGRWKQIAGTARPGWTFQEWSHRPIAGIAAAVILMLFLLPARTLHMNVQMALAGLETVLLALALSSVDNRTDRFMAMAGLGFRRILTHHSKGLASFIAVAVPAIWVTTGPAGAGVVAAVSIAMLLLLTLRLLAHRLHGKRFAELLVSILAGLVMLVAYSLPPALPVFNLALLWELQRRGREKTWLVT